MSASGPKAEATLYLNVKEFTDSVKIAADSFTDLQKDMQSTSRALRDVGIAFGAIAGVGTVALKATVQTFREFEQEMKNVQVITEATGQAFQDLNEAALVVGQTTKLTARQAAASLLLLGQQGLSASESMAALGATTDLAIAAAGDLDQTTLLLTSTIKQFRLNFDEASRVADLFFNSISSSPATIEKLANAMRYAGPVAAQFGQTLSETVEAISTLLEAGLRGEQAGTTLRNALIRLSTPTARTRVIIEELGLAMEDVTPRIVGFDKALRNLAEAGLTTAEAAEIFGVRGVNAYFTVTAKSAKSLEELQKQLDKTGTANAAAVEQLNTFEGSIRIFVSALESLRIRMGAFLVQILRPFVDLATRVVNAFNALPRPILSALTGMIALVTVWSAFAAVVAIALSNAARIELAFLSFGKAVKLVSGLLIFKKKVVAADTAATAANAAATGVATIATTTWAKAIATLNVAFKSLVLLAKTPVFVAIAAAMTAISLISEGVRHNIGNLGDAFGDLGGVAEEGAERARSAVGRLRDALVSGGNQGGAADLLQRGFASLGNEVVENVSIAILELRELGAITGIVFDQIVAAGTLTNASTFPELINNLGSTIAGFNELKQAVELSKPGESVTEFFERTKAFAADIRAINEQVDAQDITQIERLEEKIRLWTEARDATNEGANAVGAYNEAIDRAAAGLLDLQRIAVEAAIEGSKEFVAFGEKIRELRVDTIGDPDLSALTKAREEWAKLADEIKAVALTNDAFGDSAEVLLERLATAQAELEDKILIEALKRREDTVRQGYDKIIQLVNQQEQRIDELRAGLAGGDVERVAIEQERALKELEAAHRKTLNEQDSYRDELFELTKTRDDAIQELNISNQEAFLEQQEDFNAKILELQQQARETANAPDLSQEEIAARLEGIEARIAATVDAMKTKLAELSGASEQEIERFVATFPDLEGRIAELEETIAETESGFAEERKLIQQQAAEDRLAITESLRDELVDRERSINAIYAEISGERTAIERAAAQDRLAELDKSHNERLERARGDIASTLQIDLQYLRERQAIERQHNETLKKIREDAASEQEQRLRDLRRGREGVTFTTFENLEADLVDELAKIGEHYEKLKSGFLGFRRLRGQNLKDFQREEFDARADHAERVRRLAEDNARDRLETQQSLDSELLNLVGDVEAAEEASFEQRKVNIREVFEAQLDATEGGSAEQIRILEERDRALETAAEIHEENLTRIRLDAEKNRQQRLDALNRNSAGVEFTDADQIQRRLEVRIQEIAKHYTEQIAIAEAAGDDITQLQIDFDRNLLDARRDTVDELVESYESISEAAEDLQRRLDRINDDQLEGPAAERHRINIEHQDDLRDIIGEYERLAEAARQSNDATIDYAALIAEARIILEKRLTDRLNKEEEERVENSRKRAAERAADLLTEVTALFGSTVDIEINAYNQREAAAEEYWQKELELFEAGSAEREAIEIEAQTAAEIRLRIHQENLLNIIKKGQEEQQERLDALNRSGSGVELTDSDIRTRDLADRLAEITEHYSDLEALSKTSGETVTQLEIDEQRERSDALLDYRESSLQALKDIREAREELARSSDALSNEQLFGATAERQTLADDYNDQVRGIITSYQDLIDAAKREGQETVSLAKQRNADLLTAQVNYNAEVARLEAERLGDTGLDVAGREAALTDELNQILGDRVAAEDAAFAERQRLRRVFYEESLRDAEGDGESQRILIAGQNREIELEELVHQQRLNNIEQDGVDARQARLDALNRGPDGQELTGLEVLQRDLDRRNELTARFYEEELAKLIASGESTLALDEEVGRRRTDAWLDYVEGRRAANESLGESANDLARQVLLLNDAFLQGPEAERNSLIRAAEAQVEALTKRFEDQIEREDLQGDARLTKLEELAAAELLIWTLLGVDLARFDEDRARNFGEGLLDRERALTDELNGIYGDRLSEEQSAFDARRREREEFYRLAFIDAGDDGAKIARLRNAQNQEELLENVIHGENLAQIRRDQAKERQDSIDALDRGEDGFSLSDIQIIERDLQRRRDAIDESFRLEFLAAVEHGGNLEEIEARRRFAQDDATKDSAEFTAAAYKEIEDAAEALERQLVSLEDGLLLGDEANRTRILREADEQIRTITESIEAQILVRTLQGDAVLDLQQQLADAEVRIEKVKQERLRRLEENRIKALNRLVTDRQRGLTGELAQQLGDRNQIEEIAFNERLRQSREFFDDYREDYLVGQAEYTQSLIDQQNEVELLTAIHHRNLLNIQENAQKEQKARLDALNRDELGVELTARQELQRELDDRLADIEEWYGEKLDLVDSGSREEADLLAARQREILDANRDFTEDLTELYQDLQDSTDALEQRVSRLNDALFIGDDADRIELLRRYQDELKNTADEYDALILKAVKTSDSITGLLEQRTEALERIGVAGALEAAQLEEEIRLRVTKETIEGQITLIKRGMEEMTAVQLRALEILVENWREEFAENPELVESLAAFADQVGDKLADVLTSGLGGALRDLGEVEFARLSELLALTPQQIDALSDSLDGLTRNQLVTLSTVVDAYEETFGTNGAVGLALREAREGISRQLSELAQDFKDELGKALKSAQDFSRDLNREMDRVQESVSFTLQLDFEDDAANVIERIRNLRARLVGADITPELAAQIEATLATLFLDLDRLAVIARDNAAVIGREVFDAFNQEILEAEERAAEALQKYEDGMIKAAEDASRTAIDLIEGDVGRIVDAIDGLSLAALEAARDEIGTLIADLVQAGVGDEALEGLRGNLADLNEEIITHVNRLTEATVDQLQLAREIANVLYDEEVARQIVSDSIAAEVEARRAAVVQIRAQVEAGLRGTQDLLDANTALGQALVTQLDIYRQRRQDLIDESNEKLDLFTNVPIDQLEHLEDELIALRDQFIAQVRAAQQAGAAYEDYAFALEQALEVQGKIDELNKLQEKRRKDAIDDLKEEQSLLAQRLDIEQEQLDIDGRLLELNERFVNNGAARVRQDQLLAAQSRRRRASLQEEITALRRQAAAFDNSKEGIDAQREAQGRVIVASKEYVASIEKEIGVLEAKIAAGKTEVETLKAKRLEVSRLEGGSNEELDAAKLTTREIERQIDAEISKFKQLERNGASNDELIEQLQVIKRLQAEGSGREDLSTFGDPLELKTTAGLVEDLEESLNRETLAAEAAVRAQEAQRSALEDDLGPALVAASGDLDKLAETMRLVKEVIEESTIAFAPIFEFLGDAFEQALPQIAAYGEQIAEVEVTVVSLKGELDKLIDPLQLVESPLAGLAGLIDADADNIKASISALNDLVTTFFPQELLRLEDRVQAAFDKAKRQSAETLDKGEQDFIDFFGEDLAQQLGIDFGHTLGVEILDELLLAISSGFTSDVGKQQGKIAAENVSAGFNQNLAFDTSAGAAFGTQWAESAVAAMKAALAASAADVSLGQELGLTSTNILDLIDALFSQSLQQPVAREFGVTIGTGMGEGVTEGATQGVDAEAIAAAFAEAIDPIGATFKTEMADVGFRAGVALMHTFAQGIREAGEEAVQAVEEVLARIATLLPASDAKRGPLRNLTHSGKMLVHTFARGATGQERWLDQRMSGLFASAKPPSPDIAGAMRSLSVDRSGGISGPMSLTINSEQQPYTPGQLAQASRNAARLAAQEMQRRGKLN